MGGGPSFEQKQAARDASASSREMSGIARQKDARENAMFNEIRPYASDRLKNGLPFYGQLTDFAGGQSARAAAPARAAIFKRFGATGMPSGSREQALGDLEASRARSFDQNLLNYQLMNEQAKSEAARLMTGQQQIANPLGYYTGANQGYASIMNAPLQSPGMGGVLGGVLGGATSAFL